MGYNIDEEESALFPTQINNSHFNDQMWRKSLEEI
jgi:hypothetical protein